MEQSKGELITTIIHNKENTKTFEVRREFAGVKGEDIILLQLFPTLGKGDEFTMDSTNRHIITHRKELNIRSIRFINLFAKRTSARLSTKGLEIDKENLRYIESIMQETDFQHYKFVVAFGCSMQKCATAEKTKREIFDMFKTYNPKGKIFQITVDNLDSKNNAAVHVLFLGIRHSNSVWRFEEYTMPAIQESKKEKTEKKRAGKEAGENVLQAVQ